jgi:hypothetical protein
VVVVERRTVAVHVAGMAEADMTACLPQAVVSRQLLAGEGSCAVIPSSSAVWDMRTSSSLPALTWEVADSLCVLLAGH